jgi:hypothetical protein
LHPALKKEDKMRTFKNKIKRKIFGCNQRKVTKVWRQFVLRGFMVCTLQLILLTNFMELSPSWNSAICTDTQELPSI